MFNNSVYCGDKLIGFRCSRCDDIKSKMWGTICNSCRDNDRKHKELLKEMKKSKENFIVKLFKRIFN
ncbi:hypothetical protein COB55_04490 [Candidatus Wolfebacteria bacterium]|nr:MAG: hypothetical protein COB55_04490 [Candidatus Wolfebacteria bacterium]